MSWKTVNGNAETLVGQLVLVVEDEPLIALELRTALAERGAQVIGPGQDLGQSLTLAAESPITAALLDVRLGGRTVAPLAEALSERGIPFAFYTGQTETDLVRQQWPTAPVVQKPSPTRQLVKVVQALCKQTSHLS